MHEKGRQRGRYENRKLAEKERTKETEKERADQLMIRNQMIDEFKMKKRRRRQRLCDDALAAL